MAPTKKVIRIGKALKTGASKVIPGKRHGRAIATMTPATGAASIHPQGPNCVLYRSLGRRQEWQERSVRYLVACGSGDRANSRPLVSLLSPFFKSNITLQLWTAPLIPCFPRKVRLLSFRSTALSPRYLAPWNWSCGTKTSSLGRNISARSPYLLWNGSLERLSLSTIRAMR